MHSHNGCIGKKNVFGEYLCYAFVVILVTLKKKVFLVSLQVSLKTKYLVTLVAFEKKTFF